MRLFKLATGKAVEIPGEASGVEKSLQTLMESNLDAMLGVRFVTSEHFTGKVHGGRIDTLGIDENDNPVILEYKRAVSENVLNQGLFYLDWLLDHKAEFKLLVLERYGKAVADAIDWTSPRLICIAGNYTKYDEHAVRQMNRNIDLTRYRRFKNDLLALELVHQSDEERPPPPTPGGAPGGGKGGYDTWFEKALAAAAPEVRDLFESLRAYIAALGDDVQEKRQERHVAFRRISNFASVVVLKKKLLLFLHVDPETVALKEGFSRDMRGIGHWGTGDLRLTIKNKADLKLAEPLVFRSYEGT